MPDVRPGGSRGWRLRGFSRDAGTETGTNRVVRGGCWNSRARECRPSYRNYEIPAFTDVCFGKDIHGLVGFRCVRSAPAE